MAGTSAYHGRLVAFEGPTEIISTQLRLLPTSNQIAILPSVHNYLEEGSTEELFDAKRFIRRVHYAYVERHDVAMSFLEEATHAKKRLVFMNGGTSSTYAFCIKTIAEHETHGDLARAETLFSSIVEHGLAGLEESFAQKEDLSFNDPFAVEEDPAAKAMRAADALDRLTAGLQPNTDVDLTFRSRSRSMSLPMCSYADRFGDTAPFYVFGLQDDGDTTDDAEDVVATSASLATPRLAVQDLDRPSSFVEEANASLRSCGYSIFPPKSPSCIGEAYAASVRTMSTRTNRMTDVLSPRSEFSNHSSEPWMYGQPSAVSTKAPSRSSSGRLTLTRTRSVDRKYRDSAQLRDAVHRVQVRLSAVAGETFFMDDEARPPMMEIEIPESLVESAKHSLFGSGTFGQDDASLFTLSAVPATKKKHKYVDRGTDAAEAERPEPQFRPVLPFSEDLVVYFKDVTSDTTLESILRAFRTGAKPSKIVEPVEPTSHYDDNDDDDDDFSSPETPMSRLTIPGTVGETERSDELVSPTSIENEEYDPFSYETTALKPAKPMHVAQVIKRPMMPTPIKTWQSTTKGDNSSRFREVDMTNCKTAVAVQNTLRSVLNVFFPPEDKGYHDFHFSLLPEMGGLWKPVFREATPESPRPDNRRIDQILAVGSQRGVSKSYLSGISGQLEKLGMKSGKPSRSGRVDFRYLVANAMQAFTTQRLSHQTYDNPFTNSFLLATLIMPHLETYFAIHSEVRFLLLEYPPDHLSTVLALQKLVGVDLMKVAQVVDSNAKEPLPFNHIRGASLSRPSADDGGRPGSITPQSMCSKPMSPQPPPSTPPENVSISRANFLLTASATDAEITTFVSTIRKLLVEVSRFYLPEEAPKPPKTKRTPPPLNQSLSPFPRLGLNSPPLSPPPLSPPPPVGHGFSHRPDSPARSVTAPSVVDTVRTAKSGRSRRTIRTRKSSRAAGDRASVYTFNPEDDSDYDQEERRLMPIYLGKPPTRKGNSRKALKFLGLA